VKRLILFDCDGTLTDSNRLIVQAMRQGFDAHGLLAPDAALVRHALGQSLSIVIDTLLHMQGYEQHEHWIEPIAQAYRKHYQQGEKDVGLYAGVEHALQTLKQRGYRMGIVTGKSKSGLERVLQDFDLYPYFDTYRTADCCHSKPHPEMVLACMHELGMQPEQTVLVGDSHADMQLAKNAGVMAIGACFDDEDAREMESQGATYTVYHFEALLDYFPALA